MANRKKIVYLFGAGATHAELAQLVKEKIADESFLKPHGLLMSEVSTRVTKKARKFKKCRQLGYFFPASGSSNIELLISLIEENANQIEDVRVADKLKDLVKEDIERILTPEIRKKFYLHRALLELDRENIKAGKEEILGYITLNYDAVLDKAYHKVIDKKINYCLSPFKNKIDKIPLLKLHGSFKWYSNLKIVEGLKIIPLGINKNYLQLPYNYIWGHALEILANCNILRVIGCSLSQNDYRLIDLLFKAQLIKNGSVEIHIIDSPFKGDQIKNNYRFLQNIKNFDEIIEPGTTPSKEIPPETSANDSFQYWLQYKGRELEDKQLRKTTYLKKICPPSH